MSVDPVCLRLKGSLVQGHATRGGLALVSINEVNLRRARLVLGWVTSSVFNFRCWDIYLSMWSATQVNSAWPSLLGSAQWVPAKGRWPQMRLGQISFVCGW